MPPVLETRRLVLVVFANRIAQAFPSPVQDRSVGRGPSTTYSATPDDRRAPGARSSTLSDTRSPETRAVARWATPLDESYGSRHRTSAQPLEAAGCLVAGVRPP